MLRALVALLVLANLGFFAWSHGWLDTVLGPSRTDREPQRLAAQVRPDQVQILRPPAAAASGPALAALAVSPSAPSASAPPGASAAVVAVAASAGAGPARSAAPVPAASAPVKVTAAVPPPVVPATASGAATTPASPVRSAASAAPPAAALPASPAPAGATPAGPSPAAASAAPAPVLAAARPVPAAPRSCLEAGPFDATEGAAAEAELRIALPGGGWAPRQAQLNGEWMIYMGPYPDREFIERKKAELGRIRGGITHEEVSAPAALAGGLSLGRFPSPGAANATLAQYRLRGIRTARVVVSTPGTPVRYLRVAQADAATAARLAELKLPAGRAFSPCPR